ncbi:antimicrobial peptide ABC transporter permease SapC [Thalassotalea insulae]|uniref:Antimicrobial peptide ABC transporter permease SapC n=1 Tax=Thalassotalea insulae TaxID=2056778 RepID=A0ABQ6GRT6_9GAMM|nr:ABC transporter permease subunit [Thalassotalea insulae]GLX77401.1 antimicrobial peptide ABC transporter permease SapC [Thalassotalea insulae]
MARSKIYQEEEFPTPLVQLWQNFRQSPAVMIAFGCFIFLSAMAVFSPIVSPYSPVTNHLDTLLLPPSWHDDGDISFLLGTDNLGRDMLSRLMHGASLTFGLSFIVVIISLVIGVIIGSFSALTKGIKSSFLNHFLDVILSIPSLLLAIIIVALLGPGLNNTLWAIVMVLIPQFIHITRNAVKEEFRKDYVLASRLDGANSFRILYYSIFPNIIEKLISQATLAQSAAILDIATLGFLGLGAPIPLPEWGAMLANGIDLFYIAPWTVYLPGLAILFSVVATNLVGEGMRHAIKQRKES